MATAPMAKRARFNNYSAPGSSYAPRHQQFDQRRFNSNVSSYYHRPYPVATLNVSYVPNGGYSSTMPNSFIQSNQKRDYVRRDVPAYGVYHHNPIQYNFNLNDDLSFLQRSIDTIKAAKVSPPIAPKVEEIITRTQALNLLDMKQLKTRNSSVISSLLSSPSLCERCGLHNIPKDQKDKHDDWHVKKNIEEMKKKKEGAVELRVLYPSAQSWVNTIEEEVTGQLVGPKDEVAVAVNGKISPAVIEKPSVSCSDETSKVCCECLEEFKLYFDDDDDEWRMRDCVKTDGGEVCHSECARNHVNESDLETRRMWICLQSTSA